MGRLLALKRYTMLFVPFRQLAGASSNLHLLVVGEGGADREALIEVMETHPNADHLPWAGHRDDLKR